MQRRAHRFEGHEGPITALTTIDPTKILSAGVDGTVRAWNPTKGTELFRMDGFTEDLNSLCLKDNLLVTDGMEQFVCVHDFDMDESELDDGYELGEW
jgi:WD40 repeat protein